MHGRGGVCGRGDVHGGGGGHVWQVGDAWQGGMYGGGGGEWQGGHAWWCGGMHGMRWPLQLTVSILLECILVIGKIKGTSFGG